MCLFPGPAVFVETQNQIGGTGNMNQASGPLWGCAMETFPVLFITHIFMKSLKWYIFRNNISSKMSVIVWCVCVCAWYFLCLLQQVSQHNYSPTFALTKPDETNKNGKCKNKFRPNPKLIKLLTLCNGGWDTLLSDEHFTSIKPSRSWRFAHISNRSLETNMQVIRL